MNIATNCTTGNGLKCWRRSTGIDQKDVARALGVSPSTLCRIEKDDRPVPGPMLDLLIKLYADITPGSPIAQSITAPPPVAEPTQIVKVAPTGGAGPGVLAEVSKLSAIGATYQWKDAVVVPSQYYSRWSGQETLRVNEAVDRLAKQGRLENDNDFFQISYEETRDFVKIANCDLSAIELRHGLVLLTRRAVNTLTHYFNDPNSVAKSRQINGAYTSFEEVAVSDLTSRDKMVLMNQMCERWLELDTERAAMGAKIETISKQIDVTSTALEAHKQSSCLTADQLNEIDLSFKKKTKEFGHGCVQGLLQRHIKDVFLGAAGRVKGNTYRVIASRHFDEVMKRIDVWTPTPSERDMIRNKRIKDGMEPDSLRAPLFEQQFQCQQ